MKKRIGLIEAYSFDGSYPTMYDVTKALILEHDANGSLSKYNGGECNALVNAATAVNVVTAMHPNRERRYDDEGDDSNFRPLDPQSKGRGCTNDHSRT